MSLALWSYLCPVLFNHGSLVLFVLLQVQSPPPMKAVWPRCMQPVLLLAKWRPRELRKRVGHLCFSEKSLCSNMYERPADQKILPTEWWSGLKYHSLEGTKPDRWIWLKNLSTNLRWDLKGSYVSVTSVVLMQAVMSGRSCVSRRKQKHFIWPSESRCI